MQVKGKLSGEWIIRTLIKGKGRKDYQCEVCKGEIPKGQLHYRFATFPGTGRSHLNCAEVI